MEQIVRIIKKYAIVSMITSFCFILNGCAQSPYENASSQYYRIRNQISSGEGIKESFKNLPVIISNAIKDYAVSIIMVSFLVGGLLIKLVPNELKIRKKVIMTFFIGIPIAVIALTYGTAALVKILR